MKTRIIIQLTDEAPVQYFYAQEEDPGGRRTVKRRSGLNARNQNHQTTLGDPR